MNQKNILKQAAVLLLIALMVFSSGAVAANTITRDVNVATKEANQSPVPLSRELIWDNVIGVHGALGGIIVATVRAEGIAFPADDFKLTATKEVNSIFWQGGYFQCQLATGQHDYNWDWRVIFWSDDGTENHPGSEIYNQTIPDASLARQFWYNYTNPNGNTYWVANYTTDLPVPITFAANTKYWLTIQAIQGSNTAPQGCWARHNITVGGIKLHEAEIKAAWWSYTDWTNISVLVTDGLPHDLNYQLFGGAAQDTTPPVTTCTLAGDFEGGVYVSDVTVTLTATDDMSGVNYTKYRVDEGAWIIYSVPFVVSANGAHTVSFYSADLAGNIEDEKDSTFTIEQEVALTITIKGGLGVSATIKNTGTTDLTDIDWTIALDGKLIFVGKSKTGTIAALAAGAEATVKDFVVGFGK
ncbi:MAG TPA: hypothetical protein DSN98_08085, partial [Thermoplasmata archaeon]